MEPNVNSEERTGLESDGSAIYLTLISFIAVLGGLLFGFDTAVISGTIGFLREEFSLSAGMVGWAAGSALVGCIFGAMSAGVLSDRFGRKKMLLLTALLFGVSAVGSALAKEITTLIGARIVGGLGIGMASTLAPMYIAEISPSGIRGRLVSFYQLAITAGILVAYFSNALILQAAVINQEVKWRWMFGVEGIPAFLFFLLLLFVPESPRWLVKQGKAGLAERILARIGGTEASRRQLAEIRSALSAEKGSLKELFKPGLRMALVVGVVLAVLQQITGINAILYYAPEIFKQAGIGLTSAFSHTVWIGLFNMVFTLVAIWLIDQVGRKPLMIGGATGMTLSLTLIGLSFRYDLFGGVWLLVLIVVYVSSFAASLGPVVWVIISEIFPNRIRGRAMSVATVALWASNYLVSQTFPVLIESAGSALTFWFFALMCIATILFTGFVVPETKGRSLEEIERSWGII